MQEPTDAQFELSEYKEPAILPMGQLTEAQAQQVEKAVDIVKRMKISALKLTSPENWTDFGGDTAYLDDSGASMIARQFGVNFTNLKVSHEIIDEDGVKILMYMTQVTASFLGGSTEEMGIATTRDKSVAWRKQGGWLPIPEISLGNVQRKSITNAKSRATKKLLGLSYTWSDLASVGIQRSQVKKAFKEGGGSGITEGPGHSTSPPPSTQPKTGIPTEEEQRRMRVDLRNMCLDLNNGDPKMASEFLKNQSAFTARDGTPVEGKPRVDWLKDERLAITYGKIKKLYEKTTKQKENDYLNEQEAIDNPMPFEYPSEPGEDG